MTSVDDLASRLREIRAGLVSMRTELDGKRPEFDKAGERALATLRGSHRPETRVVSDEIDKAAVGPGNASDAVLTAISEIDLWLASRASGGGGNGGSAGAASSVPFTVSVVPSSGGSPSGPGTLSPNLYNAFDSQASPDESLGPDDDEKWRLVEDAGDVGQFVEQAIGGGFAAFKQDRHHNTISTVGHDAGPTIQGTPNDMPVADMVSTGLVISVIGVETFKLLRKRLRSRR